MEEKKRLNQKSIIMIAGEIALGFLMAAVVLTVFIIKRSRLNDLWAKEAVGDMPHFPT